MKLELGKSPSWDPVASDAIAALGASGAFVADSIRRLVTVASMTTQMLVLFRPVVVAVAAELPQLPAVETLESDRGRKKSWFGIGCSWNAKKIVRFQDKCKW